MIKIMDTLKMPVRKDDQFILTGVRDGTYLEMPCTEHVYRQIVSANLTIAHRKMFELVVEDGVVVSVTPVPKPEFRNIEEADEPAPRTSEDTSPYLVVQVDPQGSVVVRDRPAGLPDAPVDQIRKAILEDHANIRDMDYIAGIHRVVEVRQRDGFKTFHVLPSGG